MLDSRHLGRYAPAPQLERQGTGLQCTPAMRPQAQPQPAGRPGPGRLTSGSRSLWVAALLALAATLPLPGARADAPPARPGKLTLSTGEAFSGALFLAEGKSLDIYDVEHKRRHPLTLAEISSIAVEIEEERMQDGWMFLEEGSDKKVKLPFQYPVRKYLTLITLTGGQVIRGHAVSPIYLRAGEEERRFLLLSDQKGEKGQPLKDLAYVREVCFDADAPSPSAAPGGASPAPITPRLASLLATLNGAREACIVDAERDKGFPMKAPRHGYLFRAEGLLPGAYDLWVRGENGLFGALSVPPPADGRALSEPDREAIRERIRSIEEFFDEKLILQIVGGLDRAKLLLEMRRTKPTSMKDEASGASFKFIRWELWTLHRLETTWEIDARIFLFREKIRPDGDFPHLDFRESPSLASLRVTGARVNEQLSFDASGK
ncbi:MAG: hypothetical protein HYZ53_13840 [Planctomycetes bacterium]|nr:hypothetical protein [Planctomycetota bacterium]